MCFTMAPSLLRNHERHWPAQPKYHRDDENCLSHRWSWPVSLLLNYICLQFILLQLLNKVHLLLLLLNLMLLCNCSAPQWQRLSASALHKLNPLLPNKSVCMRLHHTWARTCFKYSSFVFEVKIAAHLTTAWKEHDKFIKVANRHFSVSSSLSFRFTLLSSWRLYQ